MNKFLNTEVNLKEKMLHGILDVKEKVYIDDSIVSYEYTEKDTDQGTTNLNSLTETTITYNGQNTWMCPGKSYLIIEGTVQINTAVPAAWTDAANGTALAFINNGLMYMFSNARYYMNGQQIEYFDQVGLTTSMNNYLTRSRTYDGLTWMWSPDKYSDLPNLANRGFALRNLKIRPFNGNNTPAAGAPNYTFNCQIPLDAIFNFCHDYKKVMLGVEHKISFTRGSSNACFMRNSAVNITTAVAAVSEFPALVSTLNNVTAGGTAGNAIVLLTKFRWAMPYVIPNSILEAELKEMLINQEPQMLTYRNKRSTLISVTAGSTVFNWTPRLISGSVERPRYIACGFIVNRYNVANVQEIGAPSTGANIGNAGTFSPGYQVNLTDAYITVDNVRYPYATTQTNFNAGQYDKYYRFYSDFYHDFHGDYSTEPCISYTDFIAFNTPYVFDVSKQPTPINNSTSDITLNFTFGAGVPANTYVFIMIYFDSKFIIQGENGDRQVIQLVGEKN